jgi:hypothetical protein
LSGCPLRRPFVAKRLLLTALGVALLALFGTAASARSQSQSYRGTLTLDIKGYGAAKLSHGFGAVPKWIGSAVYWHGTLICEAPSSPSCIGTKLPTDRRRVVLIEKPYKEVRFGGWHGACTTRKPKCVIDLAKIQPNASGGRNVHLRATFVPVGRGLSPAHPIPIGSTASASGGTFGLQVRVNSVIPNASLSPPAPAGAQYFAANLTVTNAGTNAFPPFEFDWSARSGNGAIYSLPAAGIDRCPLSNASPLNPVLDLTAPLSPGQSTSGYLCWTVASNDAGSLELYFPRGYPGPPPIWFALE